MEHWTPQTVFVWTYIAAALSGLAALLRSSKPLTTRTVLSAVLFYGAAGAGLGMFGYEFLGGKEKPWRVIACGMLVGVGLIRAENIRDLIKRIIG
jgi:hypothetical protein